MDKSTQDAQDTQDTNVFTGDPLAITKSTMHSNDGEDYNSLAGKVSFTDANANDSVTANAALEALASSTGAPDLSAILANAFSTSLKTDGESSNGSVKWNFTLPGSVQLAAGQSELATYQINLADNHGGTASQNIGILITGSSSATTVTAVAGQGNIVTEQPGAMLDQASGVLNGDALGVGKHSTLTSSLLMSSWSAGSALPTDAAAALPSTLTLSTVATNHGEDSGNNVSWQFSAQDNAFEFLAAGQTLTLAYNVTATSGDHAHSEIVTVTITGANDAPIVTGTISGAVTANGPTSTLDALSNAQDADMNDALSVTYQPNSLPAGVSYDANTHSFTLDPSNAAYQTLVKGTTEAVTVNYGVTDGSATTPDQITWTVTGTYVPPPSGPTIGAQPGEVSSNDVNNYWNPFHLQSDTQGDFIGIFMNTAGNQLGFVYNEASAAFSVLDGGIANNQMTYSPNAVDPTGGVTGGTLDGSPTNNTIAFHELNGVYTTVDPSGGWGSAGTAVSPDGSAFAGTYSGQGDGFTYAFLDVAGTVTTLPVEGLNTYFGAIATPKSMGAGGAWVIGVTNNENGQANEGWLYNNTTHTTTYLNAPGAKTYFGSMTYTFSQNFDNLGDVSGTYTDANGKTQGFVYSNGAFQEFSAPSGTLDVVQMVGPNNVAGGIYTDATGHAQGFVYSNGTVSTISLPSNLSAGAIESVAAVGPSGQVVGTYYFDGSNHGYVDANGTFTTIDAPGAGAPGTKGTYAQGITASGHVYGTTYFNTDPLGPSDMNYQYSWQPHVFVEPTVIGTPVA